MVVAEKLLGKAISQESFPDIRLSDWQRGGYGDVGIQGAQRLVLQLLRLRAQPVKLVRPAADDYDLVKPWFKCSNEPPECVRILNTIHHCFPNSGLRSRR
jgi:hypothetical protein